MNDNIHCQCGTTSSVPCEWNGPESDTVIIEWMPPYLRESHRAAGNAGVYPHNGAEHIRVHPDCAARIMQYDPEWTTIVEGGQS